jgi:hypothetical protein
MKNHEEKIDIMSLPLTERRRLCREIRAALKARVSEVKIPLSEDVVIADKTMLNTEVEKTYEKPNATELPQNSSLINNLLKRIW